MGERSGPKARRSAPVASRVHRRGSLTAEAPHRPDGPLAPPAVARRPSSGLQSSSWTTRQGASVAPGPSSQRIWRRSWGRTAACGSRTLYRTWRFVQPEPAGHRRPVAAGGPGLPAFVTGQRGAALQAARRHLARHGPWSRSATPCSPSPGTCYPTPPPASPTSDPTGTTASPRYAANGSSSPNSNASPARKSPCTTPPDTSCP
jgi:hypothetical protein